MVPLNSKYYDSYITSDVKIHYIENIPILVFNCNSKIIYTSKNNYQLWNDSYVFSIISKNSILIDRKKRERFLYDYCNNKILLQFNDYAVVKTSDNIIVAVARIENVINYKVYNKETLELLNENTIDFECYKFIIAPVFSYGLITSKTELFLTISNANNNILFWYNKIEQSFQYLFQKDMNIYRQLIYASIRSIKIFTFSNRIVVKFYNIVDSIYIIPQTINELYRASSKEEQDACLMFLFCCADLLPNDMKKKIIYNFLLTF